MLYFRDYHWLLVNGYSHFNAFITSQHRGREDVTWFLNLRYEAGGAAWRRVRHRPQVWLDLSSFQGPAATWRDLEQLNFWEPDADDEPWAFHRQGFLDFSFYPRGDEEGIDPATMGDHVWRVAARDGRWFTIELAVLPADFDEEDLEDLPALVTPDGEEVAASAEPNWKGVAELYLIERIPFGTVTVRVPRNARDPATYAFARAQELIGGLGEPEKVSISDHSKYEKGDDDLKRDLYVELQFHGRYER